MFSVSGRSACPGTLVPPSGPTLSWTFSGRTVSLDSSKPDSWQPSASAGMASATAIMEQDLTPHGRYY